MISFDSYELSLGFYLASLSPSLSFYPNGRIHIYFAFKFVHYLTWGGIVCWAYPLGPYGAHRGGHGAQNFWGIAPQRVQLFLRFTPWGPCPHMGPQRGMGGALVIGYCRFQRFGLRDRFHQFWFHPVPVTRFLDGTVLFKL